jgi:hypothetical protein
MLGSGQSRSEGQASTIAEAPLVIEISLIVRTKKGKYVFLTALSGSDYVRAMIDLGRGRWRSLSNACTGSCDARIFRGSPQKNRGAKTAPLLLFHAVVTKPFQDKIRSLKS